MHKRKHFLLVGPRTCLDSVIAQRLRRAAAALVQRRKEAALRSDFPLLLFFQAIHNVPFVFLFAPGQGIIQLYRSIILCGRSQAIS